jgi:hypothetical protein
MRRPIAFLLVVLTFVATASTVHRAFAQAKPADSDDLKSLQFFVGNWHCQGKFSNGKEISANLRFEPALDGKFIRFQHDDEPPFGYHALAYWGWDKQGGKFVSTIFDSTGGTRVFHSDGWKGTLLQWEGGDLTGPANQRFTFERLEGKSFRVSYSFLKDGSWLPVDTSVCGAPPA